MNIKELDRWFEKTFLEGTCISTIKELADDKTSVHINAPRALIACSLQGAYSASKRLNQYINDNK